MLSRWKQKVTQLAKVLHTKVVETEKNPNLPLLKHLEFLVLRYYTSATLAETPIFSGYVLCIP